MADDVNNRGARDRATVSGDEPYEVDHFAQKHGLTPDQARELIAEHGNNRQKLDMAAEGLKLAGKTRGGGDFNSNAPHLNS
jgi:hypothetical protein